MSDSASCSPTRRRKRVVGRECLGAEPDEAGRIDDGVVEGYFDELLRAHRIWNLQLRVVARSARLPLHARS